MAMMQGSCLTPMEEVEWCRKYIPITSLSNLPPHLAKAILWEVYEIGWHYKLCALNQVINPHLWIEYHTEWLNFLHCLFPGSMGLMLWSESLPSRAGDLGLTDSHPDNEHVLCSFCLLLSTWPNSHPSFSYLYWKEGFKDVQVYEVMSQACHFYIQTFFDHFGRPFLLPINFCWNTTINTLL